MACISAGGHAPYPSIHKRHLCVKCGLAIPVADTTGEDAVSDSQPIAPLSVRELSPFATVIADVRMERDRQDAKWGEQDHDPFTWLVILTEEVGETAKGALKAHFGGHSLAEYREEMVQVAAVAVAALECLDRQEAE